MRGAPKSTLTEAERRARQLAASRHWQEQRSVAFLAQGLTTSGQPRRHNKPLSPRMQKLLAEYRQRQAQQLQDEAEVVISPLELEWRKLRAEMGDILIPEIKLYTCGRGEQD